MIMQKAKYLLASLLLCLLAGIAHADCNASADLPWKASGKHGLHVEAHAVGRNCGSAIVVLAVTDAKGKPLWATSRIADQVAMFSGSLLPKDTPMKKALLEWLSTGLNASPKDTGTLPDWPQGATEPKRPDGEEFGFYIAPDVSREFYLEQRGKKLPMFCFVQGMESESCIVAGDGGAIVEIGGMTFPG
jgi:hypothetical protein